MEEKRGGSNLYLIVDGVYLELLSEIFGVTHTPMWVNVVADMEIAKRRLGVFAEDIPLLKVTNENVEILAYYLLIIQCPCSTLPVVVKELKTIKSTSNSSLSTIHFKMDLIKPFTVEIDV